MLQFIVEAVLLCLGRNYWSFIWIIIGVYLLIFCFNFWRYWITFHIPISAILGSLGFAAAVGLFFGIWPARRAAQLDPAVSLRYEYENSSTLPELNIAELRGVQLI